MGCARSRSDEAWRPRVANSRTDASRFSQLTVTLLGTKVLAPCIGAAARPRVPHRLF